MDAKINSNEEYKSQLQSQCSQLQADLENVAQGRSHLNAQLTEVQSQLEQGKQQEAKLTSIVSQ